MYKITLKIDGMSCPMCESHLNDIVRREFKIKQVKSSHKRGDMVIVADDKLDRSELERAVGSVGYKLLSYECIPYEKPGLFARFKK